MSHCQVILPRGCKSNNTHSWPRHEMLQYLDCICLFQFRCQFPSKPGPRFRVVCGTVFTLSIANSTLWNWPIVSLLILFYFILFSNVFLYMTILYALMVLLVTMLAATITSLYDITIQLFTSHVITQQMPLPDWKQVAIFPNYTTWSPTMYECDLQREHDLPRCRNVIHRENMISHDVGMWSTERTWSTCMTIHHHLTDY